MKKSFFSNILVIIFLFGGFSVLGQVRIKTNINKNNRKVVKKRHNNRAAVRIETNRHRTVINKPRRPRVIIKRPNYNRPGYFWREGYWKWNTFYSQYTWQKARWIKVKRDHYWVPGFWAITAGGFIWTEGYWELRL